MDAKIKEVVNYFKGKLLNGEFEIISIEEYSMKIEVDNKYPFSIWIGNWTIPSSIHLSLGVNFVALKFTKEESEKLHSVLSPQVDKYRKSILLTKKIKEVGVLKKELGATI